MYDFLDDNDCTIMYTQPPSQPRAHQIHIFPSVDRFNIIFATTWYVYHMVVQEQQCATHTPN